METEGLKASLFLTFDRSRSRDLCPTTSSPRCFEARFDSVTRGGTTTGVEGGGRRNPFCSRKCPMYPFTDPTELPRSSSVLRSPTFVARLPDLTTALRRRHSATYSPPHTPPHTTTITTRRFTQEVLFCAERGCKPSGCLVNAMRAAAREVPAAGGSGASFGTNGWQLRWLRQRRRTTPHEVRRLPQPPGRWRSTRRTARHASTARRVVSSTTGRVHAMLARMNRTGQ